MGSMHRPDLHALSRPMKFAILALLYFSQGVPFGLFVQALPVILREGGTSLAAIGLSSLLAIPWGLKFAWSPWVDRAVFGLPRRKGWIVPLQLVTTATLVGLMFIDPHEDLTVLLAGILFVNFLNATQDIATDGLAVEILAAAERGLGNGLQVGGYRVGMIFGGAGALVVIDAFGWEPGLAMCAAGLVVALVPVLWIRETRTAVDEGDVTADRGLATLWSYVRTPGAGRILLLLILYKFGDALASGMLRPLLVDQGHTMGDIGTIVGGVGFVAGLLGAATGGLIGDRTTRHRALTVGAVLQAIGGAFYVPLSIGASGFFSAAAIVGIEHFTGGIATVILFTCMMDWCRPEHTGADYTILASTVVIATGAASAISGISAELLGYGGHFAAAVALAIVGGAVAVRLHGAMEGRPVPDTAGRRES